MDGISAFRRVSNAQNFFRRRPPATLLPALVAAVLLQGCETTKVNLIEAVALTPGQTLALNKALIFTVSGQGQCGSIDIDWGDGATSLGIPLVDLTAHSTFQHTFSGWGGGKTVTVKGTSGCAGKVNTRFTIEPSVFSLGLAQPGPAGTTCSPVSNLPVLAPRTLVHIKTVPLATGKDTINFGCSFNGCIYDANGRPGSTATAPLPFPGLLEYSLVLRVQTQVVQGGKDMRFTTTGSGILEVCLNDDDQTNNSGGFQIDIATDQLGPP